MNLVLLFHLDFFEHNNYFIYLRHQLCIIKHYKIANHMKMRIFYINND